MISTLTKLKTPAIDSKPLNNNKSQEKQTSKPKQSSVNKKSADSFDPSKVASAVHFFFSARENSTWESIQNKFGVCANTFNRYKSLWHILRIGELPKARQLSTLRDAIMEHHSFIRPGNYYLSSTEETHLLNWVVTASERGRPFTGIQIRRMAAAIRKTSRSTTIDDQTTNITDAPPNHQPCLASPCTTVTTETMPSTTPSTSPSTALSSVSPSNQSSNELNSETTSCNQSPAVQCEPFLGACDLTENENLIEEMRSIDPSFIQKDTPCYHWYSNFLFRYKNIISAKRLKSRSAARYSAEDAEQIKKWFREVYIPTLEKYNIKHADQILAMDETGIVDNAELHGSVKYVCAKGITKHFEERGSNARYSVLHICSALGITLPPITIFQGSRMRVGMLAKAPKGTKYQFQESGYFLSDFLTDIIRHILQHHHPTMDGTMRTADPRMWVDKQEVEHLELTHTETCHRVLLMDNASVHRNVEAERLAEANNIHIVYLPPNTTHFMQVSDVSVFSSMKKKWYSRLMFDAAAAARDDLNALSAKMEIEGLTKQNFWIRFRPAWDFGTQSARIADGFARTGQWPPDENQPLKAIPALKHDEDPVAAAAYSDSLRLLTIMDENRQIKTQLAKANQQIKQLTSQLAVESRTATIQKDNDDIGDRVEVMKSDDVDDRVADSAQRVTMISERDSGEVILDQTTSFDRITTLLEQFTPPRKIQLRKQVATRSSESEIHATHMSDPNRLFDDDEAKQAHEVQRLNRLGQSFELQTVVKGNASAMGQAEADYVKALIRELRDVLEDLQAAKSAAKAKAIEKARRKRAELAEQSNTKGKRKRTKKAKVNDTNGASSTETTTSTNTSIKTTKKRKESAINNADAAEELISPEEYDTISSQVRNLLDYTPMTGAMRLRIKSIKRAQRHIDQWANWKIVTGDDQRFKVRRLNDDLRDKRPIRRGLFSNDS